MIQRLKGSPMRVDGRTILHSVVDFVLEHDGCEEPLRSVALAVVADNQVKNGGFGQCFFNLGATPEELVRALDLVGACKQAQLCRQVATLLPQGGHAALRSAYPACDEELADFFSRFNDGSRAYLECRPGIPAIVGEFLHARIEGPALQDVVGHPDFRTPSPVGESWLHDACREVNLPWVKRLFDQVDVARIFGDEPSTALFGPPGAEPLLAVLLRSRPDQSSLEHSMLLQLRDCVELLLEHDADPNAVDRFGAPIIFRATWEPPSFWMLKEAGADLSARHRGFSLIHCVESPEVAGFLLEEGADVHERIEGLTPLGSAIRNRNRRPGLIAELLKAGADPRDTGLQGDLLMEVGDDPDAVRALVEAGVPVQAAHDSRGRVPWGALHEAVLRGHGGVVEVLLSLGIDPASPIAEDTVRFDQTIPAGSTALAIAEMPQPDARRFATNPTGRAVAAKLLRAARPAASVPAPASAPPPSPGPKAPRGG